jgi:hypothetical protein
VVSNLTVDGRALSDAATRQSLRGLIGRTANASGATVVAAITKNGFWIGSSAGKVWVQLVGPLRPLRVRSGDRVLFTGTWVSISSSYPPVVGMTGGDAVLLTRQGAYVAVSTTRISVRH